MRRLRPFSVFFVLLLVALGLAVPAALAASAGAPSPAQPAGTFEEAWQGLREQAS